MKLEPLDLKKYQHTVRDVIEKTFEVLDTAIDNPYVTIGSAPIITELGTIVIEIIFDPRLQRGTEEDR